MQHRYVISVMSRDRPGIVANITDTLCNGFGATVEEVSQTVVQGYFTLIVIAGLPEEADEGTLREAVEQGGARLKLRALVRRADPPTAGVHGGQRLMLTVRGATQPRAAYTLAAFLSSRNINIEDFYARTEGEVFLSVSELLLPDEQDIASLRCDLEAIGRREGFEVHLQHENVFTVTNEIKPGARP
jgi:ACT domain-containing protein